MKRARLFFLRSVVIIFLLIFFSCGTDKLEPGPLKIVTERLPNAAFGQEYYFTLAGCGGQQPYRWQITGSLPEGIVFNTKDGVFTGKPGLNAESRTFEVKLSDSSNNDESQAVKKLTINVQTGPFIASEKDLMPLRILTAALTDGEVGSSYFSYLSATGGLPPYRWTLKGSLPSGLTFDSSSGLLSGTPSVNGKWKVGLKVSDLLGKTIEGASALEIDIKPRAILRGEGLPEFRIISTSLPAAITGKQYSAFLSATGGISPYLWRIESPLPEGIEFDPESGELSGMPTASGVFQLTFSAKDARSLKTSAKTTINLEVLPPAVNRAFPLVILTAAVPPAEKDEPYSVALSAQGGVMPYRWTSLTPLPPGLKLEGITGLISGTPVKNGSYTMKIELSDSRIPPSAAWKTFILEIASGGSGGGWLLWPLLAGSAGFAFFIARRYIALKTGKVDSGKKDALRIASDLLVEAQYGEKYAVPVLVTGGTPPYTFEIVGVLPQGFILDAKKGVITGKPPYAPPGKYDVKIKVTDSGLPPVDNVKLLTLEILPGMVEIQKKVFTVIAKNDKLFFESFPPGSGDKQLIDLDRLNEDGNPFVLLVKQLREEHMKHESFYVIYCHTSYPDGVEASMAASKLARKEEVPFYSILKEK